MNRLSRSRLKIAAIGLGALGLTLISGAGAAAHENRGEATIVYTTSNATGGNSVLAFRAERDGGFTSLGSFPTGGSGTGAGLGSQGAIVLTQDSSRLVTVNAGSNSISAFAVDDDGTLRLLGTAPSGGNDPISVTARGRLVYVLNAGSNTVSGLLLGAHGLSPIRGSTRSLSPSAHAPVQASFTPDGELLVVAEKASNTIDTFSVVGDGLLGQLTTTVSTGATPFGFDFDRAGHVLVSDAFGGAAGASALTSYRAGGDGTLHAINLVPNGESAACWVVVDRSGRHAYVANTGSGNVSAYSIGHGGTLALLAGDAATTGGHPTDEALGGHRLFVLDGPGGRIVSATVLASGLLGAPSTGVSSLPTGATGLATLSEK